jgi:signal transduction histidine kinase
VIERPRSAALSRVVDTARLLLITDDTFADLARVILEHRGFDNRRILVVGSMAEAAVALRLSKVDLILADLSLPDASGWDVVRGCWDLAADVPLIVLTSCLDVDLGLDALANGAQEHLIKGEFDEVDLIRAIQYSLIRSHTATDMRAAYRSLELLNEHLEDANSQLEQYAANASHDLRSPLRTARVLAGKLVTSCTDPTVPAEVLGLALDACLSRLETMLGGLLEYAQAQDMSTSGQEREETISALIYEIVSDTDADLRESGAQVEIYNDAVVCTHPVLVRSLLQNLVQNAVKYRSERVLRLVISAEGAEDGWVLIRVTDNGIGIEPQFRTRVFGMFERLSSRTEGVGLGLSLCHRIVALHRGRTWIEDGLDGGGVSICFTLPGRALVSPLSSAPRWSSNERWSSDRGHAPGSIRTLETSTL